MKKAVLFLLATNFSLVTQILAFQDKLAPQLMIESSLKYDSTDKEVVGASRCHGVIDGAEAELKKIGILKQYLDEGVLCTVGDFDGNGYIDFALWGGDKEQKWPDYKNYLVLFFDKNKLLRVVPIKSDFSGRLLVHYPPRSSAGPNGEPVSTYDALFEIGQCGEYDCESNGTVYIFESESGAFKKINFGKPST